MSETIEMIRRCARYQNHDILPPTWPGQFGLDEEIQERGPRLEPSDRGIAGVCHVWDCVA
jgi:hypothetical protein